MKKINTLFAVVFTFLIFSAMFSTAILFAISTVFAANPTGSQARIWTNKADYSPGQQVTIYGENFQSNGTVKLTCTKLNGTITLWNATCDSAGKFTTIYQIDKIGAPLFNLVATDGKDVATSKFTAFLSVTNSTYADNCSVTSSKGETDSTLLNNFRTSLPAPQCGITAWGLRN